MSEPSHQKLPWRTGPVASITETPKTLIEIALEQVDNHTRRILDLEKQVAELRAALEEHLNPRTRKPRKGVDPNIYGSMLYD
jgi:wobble nucleotide-excising tRNase